MFIALVYGYIQFIRIAKRAIRVLDIYLKEHRSPEETELTTQWGAISVVPIFFVKIPEPSQKIRKKLWGRREKN